MKRTSILGGILATLLVLAFAVACSMPIGARFYPPEDAPKSPPPKVPPKNQSVEALLERLAELKKQKAAIEKEEAEVSALLREKIQHLKERLKSLGVDADALPPPKR